VTYLVTKRYGHNTGLSCCFRQWRATSHCRHLHGYALAFEFIFQADTLDARNWVVDFGSLKPLLEQLKATFDHRLIVAEDDPAKDELCALAGYDVANVLVVPNLSVELFARMAYDFAYGAVISSPHTANRGVHVVSAQCWEHEGNSAVYCP
jgi:6-pyruvoyltetrahydropterin/6-carboxytetrahydropterin synthase